MKEPVGIHESKTNLSQMVQALRDGRETAFVISVSGQPCAKLLPYVAHKRPSGIDVGFESVGPKFDKDEDEIIALFANAPTVFNERDEKRVLRFLLDTNVFLLLICAQ